MSEKNTENQNPVSDMENTENQPAENSTQPENDFPQNEIPKHYANPYTGAQGYYQNGSGYNPQPSYGQFYDNNGQNYQNQPYNNNYGQNYQNQPYNNNYGQDYQNQPYNNNYGQDYQNQSYNNNYGQDYQNQSYGYNYGPDYQQGYNGQQSYGYYGQQPYGNQQTLWQQPVTHGQVNSVFFYILMVITPLSYIVSFVISKNLLNSLDFSAFMADGLNYASMFMQLSDTPVSASLSTVNSLLSIGILVMSILDIIQVHKQNYPITGLILFTIFLKPGYFLWRAHVLKQPMKNAVLYTVFLAALYIGYFFWCMSYAMNLVAGMAGSM